MDDLFAFANELLGGVAIDLKTAITGMILLMVLVLGGRVLTSVFSSYHEEHCSGSLRSKFLGSDDIEDD